VVRSLDAATGGTAAVCARLASAQAESGIDVRVVTAAESRGDRDEAALPVSRILAASKGGLAHVRASDCVHIHGVWDLVLFRAALAAGRAGVPYIVSPHGMLDPWSLRQKRLKKRLALALGYRRMLDGAAALHMLNDDEGRLAGPLRLRCPIAVVPNGLDLREADSAATAQEFRDSVPDLGLDPYVIFLGRLHHKKGLDLLIEAFRTAASRIAGPRLVIAGPDEGVRADAERRVRRYGLADRTHFIGPLFGRMKWAALRGATCFCLPSRQEGFSVAVLEAMACRLPVVISPECHFPEVGAAGAGIVAPLDAQTIGDSLLSLFRNPEASVRMGTIARSLVENRFTWERIVGEMSRVYEAACALPVS
jgi:glycosyltransferase involved in cell wall biosynthesis